MHFFSSVVCSFTIFVTYGIISYSKQTHRKESLGYCYYTSIESFIQKGKKSAIATMQYKYEDYHRHVTPKTHTGTVLERCQ